MSYMQSVVLFTFPYGNSLTSWAVFSDGSHTGTAATVQYPSWGGVSPISRREAPFLWLSYRTIIQADPNKYFFISCRIPSLYLDAFFRDFKNLNAV